MSSILKDSILKELNSIPFDTEDNSNNITSSYEAVCNGIHNYLQEEFSMTALTTGTVIQPPPAIPIPVIVEQLKGNLFVDGHQVDTLISLWQPVVNNGIPNMSIARMFQALNTYMMSPPYQVTLDFLAGPLVTTLIPPFPTPTVPVMFPTIVIQGTTCENELLNTSLKGLNGQEAKEKFWEVIARHIHIALTANVIPPIPTAGINPAGFPYTGITTCVLTYN